MAKAAKKFQQKKRGPKGTRYPWDYWFKTAEVSENGVKLWTDSDFNGKPQAFRTQIFRQAKDRGLTIQTTVDEKSVTFRITGKRSPKKKK